MKRWINAFLVTIAVGILTSINATKTQTRDRELNQEHRSLMRHRRYAIGTQRYSQPTITDAQRDAQINTLNQKFRTLEQNYRTLNTKVSQTTITISGLKQANRQLQAKVSQLEATDRECPCNPQENTGEPTPNDPGSSVQFQALQATVNSMREDIVTILDQTGVSLDQSELDTYLGNREAIFLDPDFIPRVGGGPTSSTPSPIQLDNLTRDQENLIGGVLFELSSMTQQLSQQVSQIEQNVRQDTSTKMNNASPDLEARLARVEKLTLAAVGRNSGNSGIPISGNSASISGGSQLPTTLTSEEKLQLQELLDVTSPETSIFSVARTSHMIGTPGLPQEVLFDHTFATKGIIYHPQNGTFVCRHTGFYFVTFTARTFDYKYFGVNLMKNDESLSALFSDKHSRNVMQTQSVIIHMSKDDRLWIRLPPSDRYAIDSDSHKMTTFSGFLLFKGEA